MAHIGSVNLAAFCLVFPIWQMKKTESDCVTLLPACFGQVRIIAIGKEGYPVNICLVSAKKNNNIYCELY